MPGGELSPLLCSLRRNVNRRGVHVPIDPSKLLIRLGSVGAKLSAFSHLASASLGKDSRIESRRCDQTTAKAALNGEPGPR